MNSRLHRFCGAIALVFGVLPLWATPNLPMVDLPQHLYLISVLHRLQDSTTLYAEFFALRGEITPYLGYYHTVSLLNWLLPLPIANQVFLSASVAALPLGLAFLLRGLGRPTWPCWLSLPFAYGDSFGWGFVNYCSAVPLAFFSCGFAVRAIADPRRLRWPICFALSLLVVLLFHVQVFAFLGLAVPILLLTTRSPGDLRSGEQPFFLQARQWLSNRRLALAAIVPALALFVPWVVARMGEPSEVRYGAPWKAWGPLLSSSNLSFKSFADNRDSFLPVLANILRDGSDRWALYGVAGVTSAAVLLGFLSRTKAPPRSEPAIERARMILLALAAVALYFSLPFDIHGYMYYLNTRYAHLAAPLLVCSVPTLRRAQAKFLLVASAACSLLLGVALARGFAAFGHEAGALEEMARKSAPRAKVMGLIFDPSSAIANHPVFLHSATWIAREQGGIPNFTFASTPHSPLRYRGAPPPTFPSEWRPDQFSYPLQGRFYDHFLIRGAHPAQVLGSSLQTDLAIAGQSGAFWLVRRR